MSPRVDPAERREQVADAVIDEIVAHGLQAVTLSRIAARSGLAIGSIRHYFGDAIREVMRFTVSVLIQRAERRNPGLSSDAATRLVDAIVLAAPTSEQEHKENIALVEYRVAGRADAEIGAEVAAASRAAATAVQSLLREALADRVISEEALRREALVLVTLVEGFSFSSALSSTPLREGDVRAAAEATMQRLREAYPPSEVSGGPDIRERGLADRRRDGR